MGAVEIIFGDEKAARSYARSRSSDFRILAASVTCYELGQLGTRHAVAWYKNGEEQHPRQPRPGQFYPTDGVVQDAAT